jgi:hypothetical protein
MEQRSTLPDSNRIGVLTAAVLLSFALGRLIPSTAVDVHVTLGNFFITYPINLNTVLTVFAAGLTATGMDWLLRSHPNLGKRAPIEHWFLPTLTVLVTGVPLAVLPSGGSWWVAFSLAAVLLVIVFIAEYVAVDPTAPSYSASTALLTALSFAVYLILLVALDSTQPRLVILLPSVFAGSALVSLRALRLRLHTQWEFVWAAGIALVSIQAAAALHYWPVTPLQFGLLLFGPLYALTSLAGGTNEGTPVRRAMVEPLIVMSVAWIAAVFLR